MNALVTPYLLKRTGRLIGYAKLHVGMNMCVLGALQWAVVPSRVYSCLSSSVSWRGSRYTITQMMMTIFLDCLKLFILICHLGRAQTNEDH